MLYDNNARAILRKDERDDKLDLLSRSDRSEFMADASCVLQKKSERERGLPPKIPIFRES